MTRVVHLCDGCLSGAPYRLAEVERRGGLAAVLLSSLREPDNGGYPTDVLTSAPRDELAALLESADVLHFHNLWRNHPLFSLHPWAWELVAGKPAVVQIHSPRSASRYWEPAMREPSLLKLVVAQYQARLFPECRPVPNAVPIDDPLHAPTGVENDPPVVAFTPSNCDRGGWHGKGCAETRAVLARGFAHRFATGVPWREAMVLRQSCDVAIDEIVTGSYHMCSLEALSQGLATIAGLDARTVDTLEAVTGTRDHPWIVATPATLERELRQLVEDHAYRRAKRQEARRYMEKFWSVEAITRIFAAIYREAIERSG